MLSVLALAAGLASADDSLRALQDQAARAAAEMKAEERAFEKSSLSRHLVDGVDLDPVTASELDASNLKLKRLALRQALLAERIGRYMATGDLSPTPAPEAARIARALNAPWGKSPVFWELIGPAELEQDVEKLEKQLRPRHPEPALLVRTAPKPEPKAPSAVARIERDAGARRRTDPLPALLATLEEGTPRERALAAEGLGSLGPAAKPAVPALLKAMSDKEARLRASAALALGAIGDGSTEVVLNLKAGLDDPSAEVRMSSATALKQLSLARR